MAIVNVHYFLTQLGIIRKLRYMHIICQINRRVEVIYKDDEEDRAEDASLNDGRRYVYNVGLFAI